MSLTSLGNRGGIKLTVDGHNPLPPGTAHPVTLRPGLHSKIPADAGRRPALQAAI